MDQAFSTISIEREREGVVVVLNRREKRNAFNPPMIKELTDCFSAVSRLPARYVLLKGADAFFSSGADVEWMKASINYTREENLKDAENLARMFEVALSIPKPLLCLVEGGAYGGALGLLAVSDVVLAHEEAKFCFGETKLGLVPGVVSAFIVPKIGISNARRLMITAFPFDAYEAARIGLVHHVGNGQTLRQMKEKIIAHLMACSPVAIAQTKKLLIEKFQNIPKDVRQACIQAIADIRMTEEAQQGLAAFLEKRKPPWKG